MENMGPREAYLLERARRERITITDADRECARHVDNCVICQDRERIMRAQEEDLRRIDAARAVVIAGIHDVLEGIRKMREHEIPDARIVEQVEKALEQVRGAHKRKWQS